MRKLVIEESKWYRGNGGSESRLLRKDGTMCCLGFESLACGLSANDILGVAFPSEIAVPNTMNWLLQWDSFMYNRSVEGVIGMINDDDSITDDERKDKLRAQFAAHDIELVFVP